MIRNLIQSLFGERKTVTYESQANMNAAAAPGKKTKDGKINNDNDEKQISDIERLERKYGKLQEGMTIETSLQDLLVAIPKHRARTDAYDSLVKKLGRDYGVKLIITSRKKNKP